MKYSVLYMAVFDLQPPHVLLDYCAAHFTCSVNDVLKY